VDDGRVNKSGVSGYPSDGYTSPNDFIQQLNGSGVKVGTGMLLKVMAGDAFNFRVSSWWNSVSSPNPPADPLADLITAMSSSIGAVSNKFSSAELSGSGVLSGSIGTFLSGRGYTAGKPKAYVQWILLDEQLGYVSGSSGAQQVDPSNTFKVHTGTNISLTKNGYLYIYVSNETPNIDVFFDNLQVTHIHGAILEETHYYPFGLQMAGISSSALNFGKANKKKYNGIDWQDDLGLNEYDAFFRDLDPQTGRWWQIDPEIENMEGWSPYASNYDNPITFSDPMGDEPDEADGGPGDGIINALADIGRKVVMVAGGAINAWSSNQILGAGRVDVNEMSGLSYGDKLAAKAGQVIGDVASIVTGLSEIGAGGAGSIASLGIASPVGVAVAAHGVSSIGMGATNLIKGVLNPVKKDEGSSSGRKFDGKNDTQSKTSKEAFNKAKDQNGVPRSQQPDKTVKVKENGTNTNLREHQYTNSKGEKVSIRKDNAKKYGDGGKGDQGNHYNAGKTGRKLKQHHNYDD
jgi:RHS repeat-associated protein